MVEPGLVSRVPVPTCPVPRHRLSCKGVQGGHGPWETRGHRCQKPALTPTAGGGGRTVPGAPSTVSPARADWYTVPRARLLARGPQPVAPGTLCPAPWSQCCGPQHVVSRMGPPACGPWHTVLSIIVPTMRSPARGPRLAGQAGARRAGLREHPPGPRGRRGGGQLPFTALTRGTSSQGR